MDKMDDYLKKKLTDYSEAKDGWNVPSDKAWENAVPHFPEAKNRKKIYPWIVALSALGLVIIGVLYLYNSVEDSGVETTYTTINDITNTSTKVVENKAEGAIINTIGNNKSLENSAKVLATDSNDYTAKPKRSINTIVKKETNIISQPQLNLNRTNHSFLANESNQKSSKAGKRIEKNLSNSNINIPNKLPVGNTVEILNALPESTLDYIPNGSELHETSSGSWPKYQIKNSVDTEVQENRSTSLINFANTLSLKPILPFDTDLEYTLAVPELTLIERTMTKKSKWEMGLSYSGYISSTRPYTVFSEEDIVELDEISSTASYQGMNLQFTKRFNQRWSISTGLFFSHQQLNIDLTQKYVLDTNTGIATSRSSSILIEDGLRLLFNDGVVVEDGEELCLDGQIFMDVYGLRIPVMGNYHYTSGRHEYFLSAGLSLGFDSFGNESAGIEVYREGEIIGQDDDASITGGFLPQASVYTGIGYRYQLNDRWKLGIGAYLDKRVGLGSQYIRSEIGLFMHL